MSQESKLSIVRRINAMFKLGDVGKLDSFFTRMIKKLSREVTVLTQNLTTLKMKYDQALDMLKSQLEDAEDNLNSATDHVDLDRIGTNAAQDSYMEEYLDNLDSAFLNVKSIKESMTKLEEEYKKAKSSIEDQIDSLKKRIALLSAE